MLTPELIIANCRAAARKPADEDLVGMCLMFSRMMVGVGAKYPSAISAWNNADIRHTSGVAPAGTLIFWRVGEFGHVAVSDGNGYCWSTDINGRGTVARVLITKINTKWQAKYLGWTEDVNDVRFFKLPEPVKPKRISIGVLVYHAQHGTGKYSPNDDTSRDMVSTVKSRILKMGIGKDTQSFRTVYSLWQKKLGYKGTNADGIPGSKTMAELARRSNWRVVK